MKKYSFIVLATLFFTLTALSSSAADSPSAEELAKMNAAVAKITALIADARMAIPLHILADQLKTSSDPEAKEAGAKIEKMADDMSSGGGGSGGGSVMPLSGSHSGWTTKIFGPTTPKTTLSSGKDKAKATFGIQPRPTSSGSSPTSLDSGGTMLGTGAVKTILVKTGAAKTPSALEALKFSPTKIFIP